MSVKYQLSDPWADFLSLECQILLNKIFKKQGKNLSYMDLAIVFSPNLPAGTVSEYLHYLAMTFSYLNKHIAAAPADSSDVSHLWDS